MSLQFLHFLVIFKANDNSKKEIKFFQKFFFQLKPTVPSSVWIYQVIWLTLKRLTGQSLNFKQFLLSNSLLLIIRVINHKGQKNLDIVKMLSWWQKKKKKQKQKQKQKKQEFQAWLSVELAINDTRKCLKRLKKRWTVNRLTFMAFNCLWK